MNFSELLIEFLKNIPPSLATLIIASLPVSELRGAIPIAISIYKIQPWQAFFWAVIGNMIPVIFLLWLLESFVKYSSSKSTKLKNFFKFIFDRTERKTIKQIKKYGFIALILFVAVPLPMTGAWTGCIAATLFKIPYKKALGLIFIGVLIAGIIVTVLSDGAYSLFNL